MKFKCLGSINSTIVASTLLCVVSSPSNARDFFEAINLAINTYPEVLRSQYNAKAERHALDEIGGQYLPSLDLAAGIGRENTDRSGSPDITLTRRESSATLRQLIYDGNGVPARYCQQSSRYLAAEFSVRESKEDIGFRGVEVYLDSVRTREIAILAKRNEKEHIITLDKVSELFEGGAGRKGDISLAKGRLAQTRAQLTRFLNDIKDSNAAYEELFGERLNYKIRWPSIPLAALPGSKDEAIGIALSNNPRLKVLQEDINASKSAIQDAKSEFRPEIFAEAGASHNYDADGRVGYDDSYELMLRAKWNILKGGSDYARYKHNIQRKHEATEVSNRGRRQVIEEVTNSWDNYQASKVRLRELEKYMVASREVLDAYIEQYKLGQRQLFNLLDQQNEVFDAELQYVNAKESELKETYRLLSKMGVLVDYIEREGH